MAQIQVRYSFHYVNLDHILQYSCSVLSDSLWPHGLQHAGLPCPSPIPRACSNSIKLLMPSSHLILCRPLLLLPSIFPSIRVFSNVSSLHIRWPKDWSFSFSISEYSGLISFRLTGLISLLSKGLSRVFSSTTGWKHQFFGGLPSLWSDVHICTWHWKKHSFDHMHF